MKRGGKCRSAFKSYEIRSGKYQLQGLPAVWADENEAQTLEIVLADENAQVEVHLLYGVLEETDIITRSVRIKIWEPDRLRSKGSGSLSGFVQGEFDVLRFYGKHAMERNLERTPLGHGTIAFGSRRGTSSHQYNPAVILAEKGQQRRQAAAMACCLYTAAISPVRRKRPVQPDAPASWIK